VTKATKRKDEENELPREKIQSRLEAMGFDTANHCCNLDLPSFLWNDVFRAGSVN